LSKRSAIAAMTVLTLCASTADAHRSESMAPALAAAVNLENKRQVPLLDFQIVIPGKDRTAEVIVAKLEKPLAAGATAKLPVTGVAGCHFEARWAFEDFSDAGEVDLCGGGRIVLVD
jgi:hypothetical protein